MKVLVLLALILFPLNSYPRDYLLEAMTAAWSYEDAGNLEEYEYLEEQEAYDNGSDSWDNLYLDPYADTVIIYDRSTDCY